MVGVETLEDVDTELDVDALRRENIGCKVSISCRLLNS